jgi:hypothetical protein
MGKGERKAEERSGSRQNVCPKSFGPHTRDAVALSCAFYSQPCAQLMMARSTPRSLGVASLHGQLMTVYFPILAAYTHFNAMNIAPWKAYQVQQA